MKNRLSLLGSRLALLGRGAGQATKARDLLPFDELASACTTSVLFVRGAVTAEQLHEWQLECDLEEAHGLARLRFATPQAAQLAIFELHGRPHGAGTLQVIPEAAAGGPGAVGTEGSEAAESTGSSLGESMGSPLLGHASSALVPPRRL